MKGQETVVRHVLLTCTLGPGDKGGPRHAGAPFFGSGQQNPDLILCVWVQVPQFVVGGVDSVCLCPAA